MGKDSRSESCASYLEVAAVQGEWEVGHTWQMLLMQGNNFGGKIMKKYIFNTSVNLVARFTHALDMNVTKICSKAH